MSIDLRKYARSTTFRLILGGLGLLFVVGVTLIYLFYGGSAAVSSLLCIGAGLVPVLLIIFVLWLIEWIAKHAAGN
ncbi:MAG TPA: hypothetical protein VMC62_00940 [Longilinea sp.]|nr:hypothetical protein [Longilinea sp.]